MKKKTIYTGGKKIKGILFQGEMMTCHYCGRQEKSDPTKQSNWSAIQVDNTVLYICPVCWRLKMVLS